MSGALGFSEIDGQRVELLPARLVLGVFDALSGGEATSGSGGSGNLEGSNLGNGAEQTLNLDTGGGNATGGAYAGGLLGE